MREKMKYGMICLDMLSLRTHMHAFHSTRVMIRMEMMMTP